MSPNKVDALPKMELVMLYCKMFPDAPRNTVICYTVEDLKAALKRKRRVVPKGRCPMCGK